MNDDCLFCKIIKKEIPANILYEDNELMAILDAYPNTDGHTLIIPKKHYEDIYEIPNELLIKMFDQGKKTTNNLMNKLNKTSLTFLINYGDEQTIKHIHLHLLPDFLHVTHKYGNDEILHLLKEDK